MTKSLHLPKISVTLILYPVYKVKQITHYPVYKVKQKCILYTRKAKQVKPLTS